MIVFSYPVPFRVFLQNALVFRVGHMGKIFKSIVLLVFYIYVSVATAFAETAVVQLPHTDGDGLLAKPPEFTEQQSKHMFERGKQACSKGCVTPFGQALGAVDGAIGQSNCKDTCINPEYSFLNLNTGEITVHTGDPGKQHLHYIGVVYQCVEYARKWWMINKGITFGSIDSANEILYLTEGKDIRTKQPVPLARSINGTASRPPKRGDLVIYYPDRTVQKWANGHVAVVIKTDLENGTVYIAEQNYHNAAWEEPAAYTRKLRLFNIGERYTLLDVSTDAHTNKTGGLISGWLYPQTQ